MAATNTNNVLALSPKASGGVLAAPLGTDVPTGLTVELDPAFVSLGYVSEDGVTETVSRDVEKIKAWGNQTVKILTTDHEATWALSLLEVANLDALRSVYGSDAVDKDDSTGEVTVKIAATELPEQTIVFDMYDKGTDVAERIVIPRARVTEIGDVVYTHGDISRFEITLEALEDEQGNKAYKYTSGAPADGA